MLSHGVSKGVKEMFLLAVMHRLGGVFHSLSCPIHFYGRSVKKIITKDQPQASNVYPNDKEFKDTFVNITRKRKELPSLQVNDKSQNTTG